MSGLNKPNQGIAGQKLPCRSNPEIVFRDDVLYVFHPVFAAMQAPDILYLEALWTQVMGTRGGDVSLLLCRSDCVQRFQACMIQKSECALSSEGRSVDMAVCFVIKDFFHENTAVLP